MEQYVNNMENNTSSQIHHHNNTTTSTSTSQSHLLTALPSPDFQPAKRPTRQWAAWTRQEEESFFTALRLVGKNFEKITCRVQTKNKDQVRHYYYRLVRRINKLLAPTFSLDAKNSKDTNAAMLRWWSLLEKYSCKASKLHLKPRRFKLFIEALEHQLVKDRKKNVRKRSPPGEICCASPTTYPNQNKLCAADVQAVKTDGQSVERGAHRKGCTTRRHLSMGVSHNISKEDSSLSKPTRPRRRSGTISAAAMKRWEKAAIAGVSLVADAAEHLERTACEKQNYHHCGLNVLSVGCSMEIYDSSLKEVQSPCPNLSNDVQNNVKLKLQLFPIDESTRKALEGDKHNPHLELTVGGRKKITSILEHLDRKWGSSRAASGQLMLFPFIIRRQDLLKYERWTKDSAATAAHVYALSGSPPVFRLRYGWILSSELQAAMSQAAEEINSLDTLHAGNDQTSEMNENVHGNPHNIGLETSDTAARFPTKSTQSCDVSITKRLEVEVDQEIRAGEWADSLTNVIVGDVLSDGMDASCVGARVFESSQCLGEIPFTCDSFDAAIAAHIRNQYKMSVSGLSSSIWDAEETCDAFSFQHNKLVAPTDNVAGVEMNGGASAGNKELEEKGMVEDSDDGEPMEETKNCEKEIGNLTDICWPDSLGPLELDAPKCKYYSEDVILSDSMSGLNRLIASSLDAFQNCPFFGLDDKDKAHSSSSSSSSSFAATGQQSLQAL